MAPHALLTEGEDEPRATRGSRLDGLRILVVDDEQDSRELLGFWLENNGALVTLASSASDALQILRHDLPDIVISDIAMPGMDGYEFMRTVRAMKLGHEGQLPAIAVTAYSRPEDRVRALESGYTTHFGKPVSLGKLLDAIVCIVQN